MLVYGTLSHAVRSIDSVGVRKPASTAASIHACMFFTIVISFFSSRKCGTPAKELRIWISFLVLLTTNKHQWHPHTLNGIKIIRRVAHRWPILAIHDLSCLGSKSPRSPCHGFTADVTPYSRTWSLFSSSFKIGHLRMLCPVCLHWIQVTILFFSGMPSFFSLSLVHL